MNDSLTPDTVCCLNKATAYRHIKKQVAQSGAAPDNALPAFPLAATR
jgi:hypothetical protein